MKKLSLKISTATVFVATDGTHHNNKKDAEMHSAHLHLHELLTEPGVGLSLLSNFGNVTNAVDGIRAVADTIKATPQGVVDMLLARYSLQATASDTTPETINEQPAVGATGMAPIDPAALRKARALVKESVGKKGKKSNALNEALALVARADAEKVAARQAAKPAAKAAAPAKPAAPTKTAAPAKRVAKPKAPAAAPTGTMTLEEATRIYEASKSKRGKKSAAFNEAKDIVLANKWTEPTASTDKPTEKPAAPKPPAPGNIADAGLSPAGSPPAAKSLPPIPEFPGLGKPPQ